MTAQQDIQRAGLRVMMAESLDGVPAYSADPKVFERVGNVIGGSATGHERHVRASDSHGRFEMPEYRPVSPTAPELERWSVVVCLLAGTIGVLGLLAYLRFPT